MSIRNKIMVVYHPPKDMKTVTFSKIKDFKIEGSCIKFYDFHKKVFRILPVNRCEILFEEGGGGFL